MSNDSNQDTVIIPMGGEARDTINRERQAQLRKDSKNLLIGTMAIGGLGVLLELLSRYCSYASSAQGRHNRNMLDEVSDCLHMLSLSMVFDFLFVSSMYMYITYVASKFDKPHEHKPNHREDKSNEKALESAAPQINNNPESTMVRRLNAQMVKLLLAL